MVLTRSIWQAAVVVKKRVWKSIDSGIRFWYIPSTTRCVYTLKWGVYLCGVINCATVCLMGARAS